MRFIINYLLLFLMISMFTNCGNKQNKNDLLVPNISKDCLHGQCIKNQWYDAKYSKNFFIVVIKDGAELKAKPEKDSTVLKKIRLFTQMTALYIKDNVESSKNNYRWIYVRENYEDINFGKYGWLLDSDLGFKNDFKLFTNSNIIRINFFIGDVNYIINVNNDGVFNGNWNNQYPAAKKEKGNISGSLYKFNDNMAVIDPESKELPFFINLKDEFVKIERL